MTDEEVEALESAILIALDPLTDWSLDVSVDEVEPGHLLVTVSQMYECVQVTPRFLQALSDAVGTERIDIGDQGQVTSGCESCDFGSEYEVEFHVWTGEKTS